jgi:hypothetical protein
MCCELSDVESKKAPWFHGAFRKLSGILRTYVEWLPAPTVPTGGGDAGGSPVTAVKVRNS